MESQKLNRWVTIRLYDKTVESLRIKAKKQRRKLAEYIRIILEHAADAE